MELSNLRPAEGSKQSNEFRRGRGHGSGNGKTAGKGHKGQKARSGAKRPGFEGGQMPLYRRLPKRGFKCRNSKEIIAVNVDILNRFEDGTEVTPAVYIKNLRYLFVSWQRRVWSCVDSRICDGHACYNGCCSNDNHA